MCQKLSQSVDIGYVYVVKVTACGRCELFSGTQCSCRVANQINLHIPDDSPGGSRLRTAGDLGGELGRSLLSNFTIFEALDHRRRLSSCTSVHHTRTIYRGCANKKTIPQKKNVYFGKSRTDFWWPAWRNGRAFTRDPICRGLESRPVRFQVTTLGKLLTPMFLCHQAV